MEDYFDTGTEAKRQMELDDLRRRVSGSITDLPVSQLMAGRAVDVDLRWEKRKTWRANVPTGESDHVKATISDVGKVIVYCEYISLGEIKHHTAQDSRERASQAQDSRAQDSARNGYGGLVSRLPFACLGASPTREEAESRVSR